MNMMKVAKITCEINKGMAPDVLACLRKLGIEHVHTHARRALVLREQARVAFLPPTTGLDEDPAEVFEFYVPLDSEDAALNGLVRELKLDLPGIGSVYAEHVDLVNPTTVNFVNPTVAGSGDNTRTGVLNQLACINCVVQRGLGNEIARHALESGTSVPSIAFGVGTGLRNKLGLLRVTIPAEKEVVSVIVNEHDRDEIMNSLIEAGRLDQPGRGFIGATPVAKGLINSKTFRGKQRHSATMEQIIGAIDHLKGGTEWRKRVEAEQSGTPYLKKTFLSDLVNMVLVCDEGKSGELVNAAMSAGAGGATISRIKYSMLADKPVAVSPARECIAMGVSPKAVGAILEAISGVGAFLEGASSLVETKPLPKACTYLGKK